MYESMGSELRSPDHLREVYGRGRPGSRREANGHSLNPSSTSFAAIANKSAHTPARGSLVDVGPLVIPHAQTAKLIEPGKRPLHDPPPPAQSRCDAWRATPIKERLL